LTQIEVAGVLQDAGRGLRQTRLGLLGVLDRGDPDQLRQALRETRRNAGVLMQNATVIEQVLTGLADSLSNIDPQSKQLLDAAKGGAWLKDQIAAIEELEKELNDLPELKSGSVADEVKQDNTVFVEVGDRFRVVPFASVWPVRESIPGARSADETVGRTFNGDSSVSSAILALSADKPFASVVLVSFEPPAPRQQNPFMPKPPQSVIPSRGLSEVRRRLQSANFKVVDWNLATQKEKPPAEEGLDELFVILPPAPPSPPNPFGGGTPPDQLFNDQHRRRIRDLLDNDGRALFLASWEVVGGPFGGGFRTPPYGYAPLLEGDWGLRVDNALRVVYVEPDLTTGRGFTVGLPQFQHLPVNGFTDNPIGKPMRGTRFLVSDACRIEPTAKVPDGITTERVLTVPRNENYIGADVDEIIEIVEKVNAPESGGVVELKHRPRLGPFDLMVTAERREGDQRKGKIAVMSFGGSLTDRFLKQPVLADVQKVRFDPPPTENLDLFVNALYWLADKPAYIGRGPVPVPRVEAIDAQQQRLLRAFVWIIWPVAVFVPGLVLWYVRRR
ncbi:MAG: hypothetical protein ACE5E1_08600, partial [Phycisphaerae bacterium]